MNYFDAEKRGPLSVQARLCTEIGGKRLLRRRNDFQLEV